MLKITPRSQYLFIILGFTIALLSGCFWNTGAPNGLAVTLINLTPNEDKGLKEIIGFYGGQCEYSVGVNTGINVPRIKFFEIKLENPQFLKAVENAEMANSNIACMFYKQLNLKEKDNYQEIRVKLTDTNKALKETSYTTEQLQNMEKKLHLTERVVDFIKDKQLDSLKTYVSSEIYTDVQLKQLITDIEKAETKFSAIQEFIPLGFLVAEFDNYPVMKVSGIIKRPKGNTQFSLVFYNKVGEQQIFGLNYRI